MASLSQPAGLAAVLLGQLGEVGLQLLVAAALAGLSRGVLVVEDQVAVLPGEVKASRLR